MEQVATSCVSVKNWDSCDPAPMKRRRYSSPPAEEKGCSKSTLSPPPPPQYCEKNVEARELDAASVLFEINTGRSILNGMVFDVSNTLKRKLLQEFVSDAQHADTDDDATNLNIYAHHPIHAFQSPSCHRVALMIKLTSTCRHFHLQSIYQLGLDLVLQIMRLLCMFHHYYLYKIGQHKGLHTRQDLDYQFRYHQDCHRDVGRSTPLSSSSWRMSWWTKNNVIRRNRMKKLSRFFFSSFYMLHLYLDRI